MDDLLKKIWLKNENCKKFECQVTYLEQSHSNLGDESESPWDTFLRSNNSGLTGAAEVLEIHLSPSLFDGLPLSRQPAHHLPVKN